MYENRPDADARFKHIQPNPQHYQDIFEENEFWNGVYYAGKVIFIACNHYISVAVKVN